ncbi:MAG: DUF4127 family protein [Proteobacteria bacterium]|nr:DUF4127 family protein [Pseudomonadota bacterium]
MLFIPLDDRPCTRDFAPRLATLVGESLERPPDALIGSFTTPGRPEALIEWLDARIDDENGAIISLDMLLLGGLVASRALDRDTDQTRRDLETVRRILGRARGPVDLFSILMRVPPFCTSDRDRRFSEHLLAYSAALARAGSRPGPFTRLRLTALKKRIPAAFLARYLQTRERNHAVNREALAWARDGVVDFTLVGMDDSKTEGFNVTERIDLEALTAPGRSDLIPGADEVALLLLARRALRRRGRTLRVSVHTSPPRFGERVTRYEDRSVAALIDAHVRVLGLQRADDEREADIALYVNGCANRQQEASLQLLGDRPSARHRALAREIAEATERSAVVAVADLGYANGGDRAFLAALGDSVELTRLGAFAAWNTAGNTVGTVLGHAVLRALQVSSGAPISPEGEAAHQRFLLERFVDDTLYQSVVRTEIGRDLALQRLNIYALADRHAEVQERVEKRLRAVAIPFFERHFAGRLSHGMRIGNPLNLTIRLPWPRIFEVDVDARFDVATA